MTLSERIEELEIEMSSSRVFVIGDVELLLAALKRAMEGLEELSTLTTFSRPEGFEREPSWAAKYAQDCLADLERMAGGPHD